MPTIPLSQAGDLQPIAASQAAPAAIPLAQAGDLQPVQPQAIPLDQAGTLLSRQDWLAAHTPQQIAALAADAYQNGAVNSDQRAEFYQANRTAMGRGEILPTNHLPGDMQPSGVSTSAPSPDNAFRFLYSWAPNFITQPLDSMVGGTEDLLKGLSGQRGAQGQNEAEQAFKLGALNTLQQGTNLAERSVNTAQGAPSIASQALIAGIPGASDAQTAARAISNFVGGLYSHITGKPQDAHSLYDAELDANMNLQLAKAGVLQGYDVHGNKLDVSPQKIESMAGSPAATPYLLAAGGEGAAAAGSDAGGLAARTLSAAPEAVEAAAPGLARQTAASIAQNVAKVSSKTAQVVGKSPILSAIGTGGTTLAMGGTPFEAMIAAGSGASKVLPATLNKIAGAAASAAGKLSGDVAVGPMTKFALGTMDLAEKGTEAALASQVPNLPFILGADDRDQAQGMVVGAALMHGAGYGAQKAVNGLNINSNLWRSRAGVMPETREPPMSFGSDPVADAANLKVVQDLNNGSNNFVQALQDIAKKAGGEAYVMYQPDFESHIQNLVGKDITMGDTTFPVTQEFADLAKRQQGLQYSIPGEDGAARNIALTAVRAGMPGVSFGHEVGHMTENALDPETRNAAYQSILDTYGTEELTRYGRFYDSLVNGGKPSGSIAPEAKWEDLSSSQQKSILSEMFAEHVSAVLNSIPLKTDRTSSANSMRAVYSGIGRVLESIGSKQPAAVMDGFEKAVGEWQTARQYAVDNPSDEGGLQAADEAGQRVRQYIDDNKLTATGIQPSAKVGHTVENILQSFSLDAPAIATKLGVPPRNVTPVSEENLLPKGSETKTLPTSGNIPLPAPDKPVTEIPGAVPVAPKPPVVGFKKGDPIGEVRSVDGTLLAENATVQKPLGETNGTRYYQIQYEHPDTGAKMEGTVPEQWLTGNGQPIPEPKTEPAKPSPASETAPLRGVSTNAEKPSLLKSAETKSPEGKPLNHVRSSAEAQNSVFGKQATPDVIAHNRKLFQQAIDNPTKATPLEIVHSGAATANSDPDAIVRERERLASEAATDKGRNTNLPNFGKFKTPNQKVVVPFRNTPSTKEPGVFALDTSKIIQNRDVLAQWLKENGREDPYLTSPQFNQDLQAYLKNQTNGYGGDGSRLVRPEDTKPGTIPPTNNSYTPTKLPRSTVEKLNMLMGYRTPVRATDATIAANDYFRRFAEGNKLPTTETAEGFREVNPYRASLMKQGFDPRLLNEATSQLRYRDVLSKAVPRPDLDVSGGSTGITKAGFMPEVGGKRPQGNQETRDVASGYMKAEGRPFEAHEGNAAVDESRAKRIADFYQEAKHDPFNPEVQASYRALVNETKAQWQAMRDAGIKAEPFTGVGEPYANSKAMMADVRDNKHLWFLPTDKAFGEGAPLSGNPLLEKSGISVDGKPLLNNDLFRAVHDYFGHTAEGYEFGPRGEYNAYLAHSRMFSDEAKPALAAETLAQNSWVNYGPHLRRPDGSIPVAGDEDFRPLASRPFAEQKSVVMPKGMLDEVDVAARADSSPIRALPDTSSPSEIEKLGKFKIRQSQAGNWRAYEGGRLIKEFGTFEGEAKNWLREKTSDVTQLPSFKSWFGKSIVSRSDGTPLLVFRGEHGRVSETDNEAKAFQSREASLSFTSDPSIASTYALKPNVSSDSADAPRVTPAYIKIEHPVMNDGEDPFIDLKRIKDILGAEVQKQVALKYADQIQGTNNWNEEFSPLYTGVEDVIKKSPEKLDDLYMDAYHVFADKSIVNAFKLAGYDGAIHGGNGLSALTPEYKVFDASHVKSPYNYGTFDPNTHDIRFQPSVAARDTEALPHAISDEPLQLVHYGQPGQKEADPSKFGKSGLTPRSELSGEPRSYFYVQGAENKKDPAAIRKDVYSTTVLGSRIYDGDSDPLGYGDMPNRQKADQMLKSLGYKGILRTGGSGKGRYQQVELYNKTPLTPAGGKRFLPEAMDHLQSFNGNEIKKALKTPGWAIVTATQEKNGSFDSVANQSANEQLEAEIKARGLPYATISGSYKGVDQGPSFLVTGLSEKSAQALGTKYGQESVLTPKGYRYADGSYSPLNPNKTVVGPEAKKQDGYSVLPDGTPFSASINWDKRVQPDVRDTLQYRQIAQYLTPEERDDLRADTARGLVDIFNELPSDKEFEAAAQLGSAKKGWYTRAASALQSIFGPDTDRFVSLLAATSPRQSVQENLHMAAEAWDAWEKAGRPEDEKSLREILSPIVGLEARENNSIRALKGQDLEDKPIVVGPQGAKLSGWKVENFRRNLLGDLNSVTNDSWMAQFAGIDQKKFATTGGYYAFTAKLRRVAEKLDMKPAEMQETIWSFFKTLTEKTLVDTPAKAVMESLNENDIKATPEFAHELANNPKIQKFFGNRLGAIQHPVAPGEPGKPLAKAFAEGGRGNQRVLEKLTARAQAIKDKELAGASAEPNEQPF